jgi:hypothetical protein
LVIQYWDIYSIINEHIKTLREAWDMVNLKFIFRRTVSAHIMSPWLEILQIAESLHFSAGNDAIIWQYSSTEKYLVQTLYAVVSDRGVKQVFTPVMWKTLVPPCLFCAEPETVCHLFFKCCVARATWDAICDMSGFHLITDFEPVEKMWLRGKKVKTYNVLSFVVVWSI